jgi:hypothetical protein
MSFLFVKSPVAPKIVKIVGSDELFCIGVLYI